MKNLFFLPLILSILLFNNLLFANEINKDCFPFKEEWGMDTEEFEKNYKNKFAEKLELNNIISYITEINLYEEKAIVGYDFEKNELIRIQYVVLQHPKKGILTYDTFKRKLNCLLGEPTENISSKKDNLHIYYAIWRKEQTTIYLSFAQMPPAIGIDFLKNNNIANEEIVKINESFIKKMKYLN